jgi:hypothetical protein
MHTASREIERSKPTLATFTLLYYCAMQKAQRDQRRDVVGMGTCQQCGKPLKRLSRGRPRKWCSVACSSKAGRIRRMRESIREARAEGMGDVWGEQGFMCSHGS